MAGFRASDFDLTLRIAPFLDRHMVLPLLEFMQDNKVAAHARGGAVTWAGIVAGRGAHSVRARSFATARTCSARSSSWSRAPR
jgi:hypothetical protein